MRHRDVFVWVSALSQKFGDSPGEEVGLANTIRHPDAADRVSTREKSGMERFGASDALDERTVTHMILGNCLFVPENPQKRRLL